MSDSVAVWKQHNVSHVSVQGGNFTGSAFNRSEEEFDPLGGHTVWQVMSPEGDQTETPEMEQIIQHGAVSK